MARGMAPARLLRGELNKIMERPLNFRTQSTRFPLSRLATWALCAVPALVTQHAAAHIRMDQPVARNVWAAGPFQDPIKQGPCGSGANDPRTTDPEKINTFAPGETITVSWNETIDHPGFYRISIDMDGQDDFVTPTSAADIQDPPVLPILMDGIPDEASGTYSVEVTLPNETCDNCTLQLIQFMDEDEAESYFVCADLVIEGPVNGDGDGDGTGGAPDTTTETTEGAGGTIPTTGSGGQLSSGGSTSSGGAVGSGSNTGSGGQLTGSGGVTEGETGSEGPGPSGDDEVESGAGCSVSRGLPTPGSAVAWLCGLVGLAVVSARRRIRR